MRRICAAVKYEVSEWRRVYPHGVLWRCLSHGTGQPPRSLWQ